VTRLRGANGVENMKADRNAFSKACEELDEVGLRLGLASDMLMTLMDAIDPENANRLSEETAKRVVYGYAIMLGDLRERLERATTVILATPAPKIEGAA